MPPQWSKSRWVTITVSTSASRVPQAASAPARSPRAPGHSSVSAPAAVSTTTTRPWPRSRSTFDGRASVSGSTPSGASLAPGMGSTPASTTVASQPSTLMVLVTGISRAGTAAAGGCGGRRRPGPSRRPSPPGLSARCATRSAARGCPPPTRACAGRRPAHRGRSAPARRSGPRAHTCRSPGTPSAAPRSRPALQLGQHLAQAAGDVLLVVLAELHEERQRQRRRRDALRHGQVPGAVAELAVARLQVDRGQVAPRRHATLAQRRHHRRPVDPRREPHDVHEPAPPPFAAVRELHAVDVRQQPLVAVGDAPPALEELVQLLELRDPDGGGHLVHAVVEAHPHVVQPVAVVAPALVDQAL